jgi:hypothetical protein
LKKLPVFNQNPLLKDHPFNNYCSTFHIHFTCIKKPPVFRDYSLTLLWSDYEYRFDCSYVNDQAKRTCKHSSVVNTLVNDHIWFYARKYMKNNQS